MSLTLYKKKRIFSQTPEPEGKKNSRTDTLRFVVQKHAASRLHYDFRLEMEGVLKSWAIPKGPSSNPEDKRLAMMVEDHPFDYRSFEGIIPEGNYGAGTVMVWDEGTFESLNNEGEPIAAQEKILLKQLKDGDLKFVLHGKKLKGAYALVKLKKNSDNSWLLIKKVDKYASTKDITKKDKSILSERTLDEISNDKNSNVYGSNKKNRELINKNESPQTIKTTTTKTAKSPAKKAASKKKIPDVETVLKKYKLKARTTPIPKNITPMMATLVDGPFDDDDWIFEIKWDGYRAVATMKDNKADIRSRNDLSFSEKYYVITEALEQMDVNAVLDGEIIAVDEEGLANFQSLQSWQKKEEGTLLYYVFDILWLNGYNLKDLPLTVRKEILKEIIPENNTIRYSDHITGYGTDFFQVAKKKGLEGIIAKHSKSTYQEGLRSKQWLKIKTTLRQEVVICGYTQGRAGRKHFGALILGVYQNKELIYVGHTGSGFNDKSLSDLWKKLQPLKTDKSPFAKKPKTNMPATWVKPILICEIKFQEWTQENLLRQPIFLGLRTDKKATEVKKENAMPAKITKEKGDVVPKKITSLKKSGTSLRAVESISVSKTKSRSQTNLPAGNKDLFAATEKEKIITIDNQELKFTNLDKVYWKKEKYTKRDLLNYYHSIAPYMLPYMLDRPQSLNRHPTGIEGMSFYQKDVRGKVPDWVETHPDYSESNKETIEYFVCTNEASLLYLANLGCIEMNPWHSRTKSPDNPDYCLIDLDPYEIGFEKVIETAQVVKHILDDLNIPGYSKTSGSTGIHIYIPLGAKYNYDQSKNLAELLVTLVHHEIPSFTSLERNPQKRRRKIYLDFLQNRQTQTVAAPYSVRPKPGATVSTPLYWEEVKKGLSPSQFTIKNIMERLKSEGDIFTPVLQKGIDLIKTFSKIESVLSLEK